MCHVSVHNHFKIYQIGPSVRLVRLLNGLTANAGQLWLNPLKPVYLTDLAKSVVKAVRPLSPSTKRTRALALTSLAMTQGTAVVQGVIEVYLL